MNDSPRFKTAASTKRLDRATRRRCAPVNPTEALFAEKALAQGWTFLRRGWPDFICWRHDELIFVEVKQDSQSLKEQQRKILELLAAKGLRCFRWSPAQGFVRVHPGPLVPKKRPGGDGL